MISGANSTPHETIFSSTVDGRKQRKFTRPRPQGDFVYLWMYMFLLPICPPPNVMSTCVCRACVIYVFASCAYSYVIPPPTEKKNTPSRTGLEFSVYVPRTSHLRKLWQSYASSRLHAPHMNSDFGMLTGLSEDLKVARRRSVVGGLVLCPP